MTWRKFCGTLAAIAVIFIVSFAVAFWLTDAYLIHVCRLSY